MRRGGAGAPAAQRGAGPAAEAAAAGAASGHAAATVGGLWPINTSRNLGILHI